MKHASYFIHAVTPLHAGIGQGAGDIDLPIARERATNMPYLPGSSLKGALRATYSGADRTKLFGPDTDRADEHAGSLQISDARLLFFPVRGMRGVFAYVTSPFLLRRFQRDAIDASTSKIALTIPVPDNTDGCFVSANESILVHEGGTVWLEDLRLTAAPHDSIAALSFIGERLGIDDFTKRICLVSDDVLSFLVDTATEVTARIRLHEEKLTVAKGALWYEEALPAETILTGLIAARSIRVGDTTYDDQTALDAIDAHVKNTPVLQLGGHATIGRGVCRISLAEDTRNEDA